MQKIKVGFVGARELEFTGDFNERYRRSLAGMEKLSEELGFDLHTVNFPVINASDAEKAVKECEHNNVDFLLLQLTTCCADGTLIPIFARIKNARLGIWAIPEEATEGPSPLNSFVGLTFYAGIIGNYIREREIPFKWFYGNAGDEMFKTRLGVTVRALTALKKLCNSKVALVGGVSYGFGDLYYDGRSVQKTFQGIKLSEHNEYREIRDKALSYNADEVAKAAEGFVREAKGINEKCMPFVDANVRIYMAYKEFIRESGCDALALNCIYKLQEDFKTNLCAVIGKLNDDGTVVSCEGDFVGAISMLLLKYLTGNETSLMDFPQYDEKDDSILMWHCGATTKYFACDNCFTLETSYSGMPIVRDLSFKPEHVTIARIAGEADLMLVADGHVMKDKKGFLGSRGWIGDLRLNTEKISAIDFVNTVLVNKFPHHYPIVFGDATKEILEIANWLSLKLVKKVPYEDYFQAREL